LCLGLFRIGAAFPRGTMELEAWLNRHGPSAPGYPVGAARYVATAVPRSTGRLINEFNWGGYLAWRLGDRYQVLLDGRTQVYSPEFWRETYLGSEAARRRFFAGVRADAAVLPAERSLFRKTLVSLGWRTSYRDERAEVMVPGEGMVANVGE
jgi:hypothetical protein